MYTKKHPRIFRKIKLHKKLFIACCSFFFTYSFGLPLHAVGTEDHSLQAKDSFQLQKDQVILKGKVIDQDSLPLPGVSVVLQGSYNGVATNRSGNYRIIVPQQQKKILIFSFIGMETQEIEITDPEKEILILMKNKATDLDEVVKTGYYSTTIRRASGSITVLTNEAFENKIPTSIDDLLHGLAAGVSVSSISGRPGEASKIRIRGTNTISGDAEPLWVVDGIPLQDDLPEIDAGQVKSGDLNEIFINGIGGINPNDIENVTILKDAAAAAIYGSRAAGGVIVITTKQGHPGKMRINYSANFGMGLKPQRDAGLMNTTEKLSWEQELWNEFSAERYASQAAHYPVVGIIGMLRSDKLGKNGKLWTEEGFEPMSAEEQDRYIKELSRQSTDWYDVIFQNSFTTNHNLSLSGGGRQSTYYASFGYTSEEGLVKETSYDRYNLNLKIKTSPSKRMKLEFGISTAFQESDGPSMGVDPFTYAYFANPYERPYNDDGSYRADMTYYNQTVINDGNASEEYMPTKGFNIIREMKETSGEAKQFSATGRTSMEYRFTSKVKFSGLLSYTYTNNRIENILGKNTYAAFTDRLYFDKKTQNLYGSITQSTSDGNSYNARGHFIYTDTYVQNHFVNLLAGAELRGSKNKRFFTKRYGYNEQSGNSSMPDNPDPDKYGPDDYITLINGLSGQTISESTYASFYASLEYTYKERYILNASFRTDGSNNFGSKEQFNPTWSLGAAWNMDNENFMQALKPVINRLTLRAAGGFTGNVVPGIYKNLVVKYDENNYWHDKLMGSVGTAPNPKLRWEKTWDMKIALDFGLFDERITGLVESYYRKSRDVISRVRVVSSTGFNAQNYNSSEIVNKGIEATLKVKIIDGKNFNWSIGGNIAWNRNVLTRYTSPNGTISEGKYVEYPLESIFGGKSNGIDPYDGIYTYQLRPDAQIKKASDLANIVNYRYYLGTSIAPFTGGFNMHASFRNLSLSIGGNYSFGAKIDTRITTLPASYQKVSSYGYSGEKPQSEYSDLYRNHLNVKRAITDRWTPSHTDARYPRIVDALGDKLYLDVYNPIDASIVRGSFIESVSYLRIRDITLSYALPRQWLNRLGITSLNFSLTMNNFLTFTNYSGIDPETPGMTYPITRSMALGIHLGF